MEIPRNAVFNTNEVFVIVEDRLQKRQINIIKENEKTLIFNGLEESEMIVLQPLINVLEGTLVERLGSDQDRTETNQAGDSQKRQGGAGDTRRPDSSN